MITEPSRVRLARRAWISDGSSGATVAPDGTIDWYQSGAPGGPVLAWRLCDPDGPAVRVGVASNTPTTISDSGGPQVVYLPGTNVAETVTRTTGGRSISVTDFVEWTPAAPTRPRGLTRLVRALAGPVEIEVELVAGRRSRVLQTSRGLKVGDLTIEVGGRLTNSSFVGSPYGRSGQRWRALATLDSGQDAIVVLCDATSAVNPDVASGEARLASTTSAWTSWLAALRYDGPYEDAVVRSLLTLRSLTDRHGAAGGAATTSLPRRVGSERSSDARWVTLRDVAATVELYSQFGFEDDASAAETWLRNTVTQASRPWPAHYDKDGQPAPEVSELAWQGWRGSQPVVVGRRPLPAGPEALGAVLRAIGASTNGSDDRFVDAGPLSAAWPDIAKAVDGLCDGWDTPSAGRWEFAGNEQRFTSDLLATWGALTKAAAFARASNPLDMSAAAWRLESSEVAGRLSKLADLGEGTLSLHAATDEADAALLTVAWEGPWPADHPVVAATVERTLLRLSSGLLVHRYSEKFNDGIPGPDLPDLEATFLAVRALALLRRWEDAHERMEAAVGTISRSGPGVLAETADPASGVTFGNLAYAPAAVALLEAAVALSGGPR